MKYLLPQAARGSVTIDKSSLVGRSADSRELAVRTLERGTETLHSRGRIPPARLTTHRTYTCKNRRREVQSTSQDGAVHTGARSSDREPGLADGPSRTQGHIRQRLASCGRHEPFR